MVVFVILAVAVALLLCFWGGAVVGINDCKTRFRLPKKACGVDDDGHYIY